MEDEDIEMIAECELFDISDVSWNTKSTKDMKKIYLIAEAEDLPFNLMKYYLALKAYVFKMEAEIGVFEESPDVH